MLYQYLFLFLCFACDGAFRPIVHAAAEPFGLPAGQAVSIGHLSVTAAGGYRVSVRGSDHERESFVFVRDGARLGEHATIVVREDRAMARRLNKSGVVSDALAYMALGLYTEFFTEHGWRPSENLTASRKWTADGIDFFYTTLERRGENYSLRGALVTAAIDDDLIYIDLEAPASMWADAYDGLVQFISAMHRG